MSILELLTTDRCLLDAEAGSKKRVLETISGLLAGEGCIETCAPFTADILGEYNANENTLSAEMQDGQVDMTELMGTPFIIPFIGTMDGAYADETLSGTWAGVGTVDPPFATTVDGEGTWEATRPATDG